MKSIQTKITALILAGIMISVMLVGGIGIHYFKNAIDDDSVRIMNSICNEKAEYLNNILTQVEQTVNILSYYVIDNLESIDNLSIRHRLF